MTSGLIVSANTRSSFSNHSLFATDLLGLSPSTGPPRKGPRPGKSRSRKRHPFSVLTLHSEAPRQIQPSVTNAPKVKTLQRRGETPARLRLSLKRALGPEDGQCVRVRHAPLPPPRLSWPLVNVWSAGTRPSARER